ncbi:prepilin-type N-terminal cleavage/methylation domain-containing protein [Ferrimonas kyonanensis]|uniref:prepilin-type N-terminal cleavage/methylation domain-containing protein n=1 Tax=Ferrimonas kyonanensis TaxID=364763 RepID=UPI000425CDBA|nr:prepilin-type N-terminal cleavage/methylation domain-containing protein [Ferrimonas kyonanensis]
MKKQSGFSLVELVIVVVVLGLLAAVALPRFINITDEAEDAASEGVAGGFASAIGITRAQWEVEGRPDDGKVLLGGTDIGVNEFGYPSGDASAVIAVNAMNATRCNGAFGDVLQSPPPSTEGATNKDLRNFRYTAQVINNGGATVTRPNGSSITADLCIYHQVATLNLAENGRTAGPFVTTTGKGFTYDPGTGQVVTFTN